MTTPQIVLIPCLSDNYAVLMHDADSGTTVLVDAPEAAPIAAALKKRDWTLTHILVTHHHADHVAGIEALKAASGARVIGPAAEADRIPGIDDPVAEGDTVTAGPFRAEVIATPGHTLGHVVFHFPDIEVLFAGDTLFSLGCGRLLEGTAAQMWDSLGKLAALPDDTTIYCGHEYTQANAKFALTIEPENAELVARAAEIDRLRGEGRPTLPTTIAIEKATNPFLRVDAPAIRKRLGLEDASQAAVFAEIRKRKDNF